MFTQHPVANVAEEKDETHGFQTHSGDLSGWKHKEYVRIELFSSGVHLNRCIRIERGMQVVLL